MRILALITKRTLAALEAEARLCVLGLPPGIPSCGGGNGRTSVALSALRIIALCLRWSSRLGLSSHHAVPRFDDFRAKFQIVFHPHEGRQGVVQEAVRAIMVSGRRQQVPVARRRKLLRVRNQAEQDLFKDFIRLNSVKPPNGLIPDVEESLKMSVAGEGESLKVRHVMHLALCAVQLVLSDDDPVELPPREHEPPLC